MKHKSLSLRPFIGAKDFEISRRFYTDLGFKETVISPDMSVFEIEKLAFYLQDYYVKDWINNSMLFLEVDNVDSCYDELLALNLTVKYKGVKLSPIRDDYWGRECFLHDPSGVLWHFGEFKKG
ncbi:MAG: VOC family protein [Bacteroidota bacterium]